MKNAQFLHIKQYEDYNQDEDGGLVICKHCSDRIMDKTNSVWTKLTK